MDRVWIGRFSNLAGRVELNVIDVGEYDLVRVDVRWGESMIVCHNVSKVM